MTFVYVPGLTDGVCFYDNCSMKLLIFPKCADMREYMSRYCSVVSSFSYFSRQIHLGMRKRNKLGNVDTLTYDPTNKSEKRRAAGCVVGYCNTAKTCDEVGIALIPSCALTSYFLGPVSICVLSGRWDECIYRVCTKGPEHGPRDIYEVLVPRQWIFSYPEQWEIIRCRGS